jgi:hypothetical protein
MEKKTTIMWEKYYEDLPIPSYWENVSYGNDELPSFSCNGYQVWINHPTLEVDKKTILGLVIKIYLNMKIGDFLSLINLIMVRLQMIYYIPCFLMR